MRVGISVGTKRKDTSLQVGIDKYDLDRDGNGVACE
jgi:hypothetical protein